MTAVASLPSPHITAVTHSPGLVRPVTSCCCSTMQTRLLALLLLLNTAAQAQICFGGCPGGGSTVEEEVEPVPDCTTPHGRPGRCAAVIHIMEDKKLVLNFTRSM